MGETELLERIPEQGLTIGEQAALLWTACRYASMENHAACPVELLRELDECPFGDKAFRSMRGTRFCGSGIREKFSANRGNSDAEGTGKDF